METPILNQYLTTKYFKIFNKEMNTYESRIKSFENWPVANIQNPATLSSCGFYYLGESDKVACFYCGSGAHEWLSDDNPWVEHAIHSNKCTYLLINKSRSLQADVKQTKESAVYGNFIEYIIIIFYYY